MFPAISRRFEKSSGSTKFRVGFNGSFRVNLKGSSNDSLHAGSNPLNNVLDLILKWWHYRYVYVAEIEKIFKQRLTEPDDQNYQYILWRFDTTMSIQICRLTTVTCVLTCSPFLPSRVLKQLDSDYNTEYPLGSSILASEI